MRNFLLIFLPLAISSAQGGARVEGSVLNSATGRPLSSAIVVLQGLVATGDPPQPDSYVAETDSTGRFKIENVLPGRYEARAQCEGFTAQPPSVSPAKIYPHLLLEKDQVLKDVTLKLIPLGVIAGKVLDPDGDPVVSAPVEALRYAYVSGKKELQAAGTARANGRGEFRIIGLAPGRYFLRFTNQGFMQSTNFTFIVTGPKPANTYATTYFPSAREIGAAVSLDLPPGGELRDQEIRLQTDVQHTIRLKLEGNPTDDSRPMISIGSPSGVTFGLDFNYGRTFEYPAAPGVYVVEGREQKTGLRTRRIIKVTDSDVDVNLALAPEIKIAGTVQVEGNRRVAMSAVEVILESEERLHNARAAVQANGSFTVAGLAAVPYRVRVSVPSGAYVKSLRLNDRALLSPKFEGGAARALAITLATDGGVLHGVAKDAAGAPADGATAVLVPAGAMADWTDLVRSATTAEDGRFELHDIAPGDYILYCWDDAEPGAPLDPDFRKPYEKHGTPVHLDADATRTVEVKSLPVTR